ncbi:MAG: hypothetical protein ACLFTV_04865 [Desulfococcaceae bacterium]
MPRSAPPNRKVLQAMNRKNGVAEPERRAVAERFRAAGGPSLDRIFHQYAASMDGDVRPAWSASRPPEPRFETGPLPEHSDLRVELLGVGGLAAAMNTLYQAHKHRGPCALVTHPHDVWTFAAWTLHPEEDMDQRLVAMYRTFPLLVDELRGFLGLRPGPLRPEYKSFRIDYPALARLMVSDPEAFGNFIRVAGTYVFHEFTDRSLRFARANLARNGATLRAVREMGLMGDRADRDLIHPMGRIVYERPGEPTTAGKVRLKREYGLDALDLPPEAVRRAYGSEVPVMAEVAAGTVRAAGYAGGRFLPGFRENLFAALEARTGTVFEGAVARTIRRDPVTGRHAVVAETGAGETVTVVADHLLLALGRYDGLIPVDGLSTLFAIRTTDPDYKLFPTGMGEGGNIHIVPAGTARAREGEHGVHYHLGKATNGAVMGRHPLAPKRIGPDIDFWIHLEANLRKLLPPDGRLVWLYAAECGRPVSARQGYTVRPLFEESGGSDSEFIALNISGGCGLGANTAILPDVQALLDARRSG